MKFSSQEEYGLRCLLQIGRKPMGESMTIAEIAAAEGLTEPYVAKLLRILRMGGFIDSVRGQSGGYSLARPASDIVVGDVLASLGGKLFEDGFCTRYSGDGRFCTHTVDCSIRSLWTALQQAVDGVVDKLTVADLIGTEAAVHIQTSKLVQIQTAKVY